MNQKIFLVILSTISIVSSSSQNTFPRPQYSVHEGEPFKFCFDETWGKTRQAFQTCVELEIVQNGLSVSIQAENDTIQENAYVKCNDDIYNQEVVEVFISNSTAESPESYWEVEVSPKQSVWLGYDYNPGGDRHNLSHTYYPCDLVNAKVTNSASSWKANLVITNDMLGEGVQDCGANCHHYTANFFRVQMIPSIWTPYVGHVTRDMVCSPDNCTFSCANRPDTPEPDFHQTKYFDDLYLYYSS